MADNDGMAPDPQTLGFEDVDTIDFNRGPAVPASWQVPDPSRLDDFIHTLQDKNVDLRRIMQVMRQNGAQIADGQDAYVVEELNTSRKAAQIKAFIDDEVSPVLKQMNVEGLTLEEVEEYLHARHAPEANQRIADINPGDPNLQDGGSGMLTQDALDYMANLPAAKRRELPELLHPLGVRLWPLRDPPAERAGSPAPARAATKSFTTAATADAKPAPVPVYLTAPRRRTRCRPDGAGKPRNCGDGRR